MNKQELIAKVAENSGVTKGNTEKVIEAFTSTVEDAVASGETVKIVGFGAWEKHFRSSRKGRNPRTGEAITVPEKNTVHFKVGSLFKDAIK